MLCLCRRKMKIKAEYCYRDENSDDRRAIRSHTSLPFLASAFVEEKCGCVVAAIISAYVSYVYDIWHFFKQHLSRKIALLKGERSPAKEMTFVAQWIVFCCIYFQQ